MDLKDFVKETIVQISNGINAANAELKDAEALVNPRNVGVYTKEDYRIYGYLDENEDRNFQRIVELVEFDVAVHAREGKETQGGIGITVGAIAVGSRGKSDAAESSDSRIKFKIPVVFPNAK